MQKFTQILEDHVQWIALGLAALFMAWVIWAYAVHSQVAVQLGTTPVQPGQIDSTIVDGPIKKIKGYIQSPNEISIAVPDLLQPWIATVSGPAKMPDQTKVVIGWNPHGSELGPIIVEPGKDATPIDHVVTLPPAIPVAVSTLRTTVEYPDPKQPAPVGNTHVQQAMITTNLDGVSVLFKIEIAKLSKEFHDLLDKKANIPALAYQTEILKVDLIREEKLPNGQWGNATTIKPLIIHAIMDYPGDTAARDKGLEFKDWAAKHADEIIHPDFYQTAQGAPAWHRPDQQADITRAPVQPVIAPTPAFVPPTRPPLPGVPNRPVPRGTAPPKYAPADPARPAPYGRAPGGYPAYPGGYPMPGGLPGGYPGGFPGGYQRPYQPNIPQPFRPNGANFGTQGGVFDPTQLQNDIEILAHDDTVEAGKTYRYRLVYRIYNSLYDINVISKPEIAKQFAIGSKPSEASGEITIPQRTNFFVKSITVKDVQFDVFTWDGVMKINSVKVVPGDSIGKTNWSVVDIRHDNKKGELYVLLSDDSGNIQRRDFRADQDNPDYKNLLDEVKAAPAASAR